jgi:hypothetical protein
MARLLAAYCQDLGVAACYDPETELMDFNAWVAELHRGSELDKNSDASQGDGQLGDLFAQHGIREVRVLLNRMDVEVVNPLALGMLDVLSVRVNLVLCLIRFPLPLFSLVFFFGPFLVDFGQRFLLVHISLSCSSLLGSQPSVVVFFFCFLRRAVADIEADVVVKSPDVPPSVPASPPPVLDGDEDYFEEDRLIIVEGEEEDAGRVSVAGEDSPQSPFAALPLSPLDSIPGLLVTEKDVAVVPRSADASESLVSEQRQSLDLSVGESRRSSGGKFNACGC